MAEWGFVVWCVAVGAGDLWSRRIPNWLTYPVLLIGLTHHSVQQGLDGFVDSALGVLVAVPFAVLFALRLFGGGDVKCMAAIGAVVGFNQAVNIALTAIFIGAGLGALVLIWQGRLLSSLKREGTSAMSQIGLRRKARESQVLPEQLSPEKAPRDAFPFGLALSLSAIFWVAPLLT